MAGCCPGDGSSRQDQFLLHYVEIRRRYSKEVLQGDARSEGSCHVAIGDRVARDQGVTNRRQLQEGPSLLSVLAVQSQGSAFGGARNDPLLS